MTLFGYDLPPDYSFYSLYRFPPLYRVGLHKTIWSNGKLCKLFGMGFGETPALACAAAVADIEKTLARRAFIATDNAPNVPQGLNIRISL